jgi:hypothetical protein
MGQLVCVFPENEPGAPGSTVQIYLIQQIKKTANLLAVAMLQS